MKRSLWALTACLLAFGPAFGQQKEPPAPTIKRRSELVLVPVVVTPDGIRPFKGRVRGLTAKDFILLHNGQPEQIAEFEEIEAIRPRVARLIVPPRTVQNYAPADSHQDVIILLLDYLHANRSADALMRSHFIAMVQELTAMRLPFTVLVLSHKGLVLVHSYTSDPENISKAVAQWISDEPAKKANKNEQVSNAIPDWASLAAPMDAAQTALALQLSAGLPEKSPRGVDYEPAGEIGQEARTLRAIEQLAEAFRGIPGRKKLFWTSTGTFGNGSRSAEQNCSLALEGASLRAWKSLSDANIALYPIIARRPVVTEKCDIWYRDIWPFPSIGYELRSCTGIRYLLRPIWFSIATALTRSDRVCDEPPGRCLFRALIDTHYYLLGFYLHGDNKPGWHNVQVQINQPETTVDARDGFFVYDDGAPPNLEKIEKDVLAKASANDDAVAVALSSPLDYTSIPLRLHWTALNTPGKETQVELVVSSPPGAIAVDPYEASLNVDFLAFFKPVGAKEGQPFPSSLSTVLNPEQQKNLARAGFKFRNVLKLAPGRYELRVLLRDNLTRKMGTVSTIIDLTPAPASASGEPKR